MTTSRKNDTQRILRHWREAAPNDRMAHLIRDTERAFRQALQERLSRHDVSFGHWTFLRVLWERDGLTQSELSTLAGVMDPTTSTAIRAMEARGYVQRVQVEGNRKSVFVHLTSRGRALEGKLVPLAENANLVSTRGIPPDDLLTTRRVLLRMIENLAEDEAAGAAATRRRRRRD